MNGTIGEQWAGLARLLRKLEPLRIFSIARTISTNPILRAIAFFLVLAWKTVRRWGLIKFNPTTYARR